MTENMAVEGWMPSAEPVLWPCVVMYFGLLPEPLPAPSGYSMRVPMPPLEGTIATDSPPSIDSTVAVRFWQVETISGIDGRAIQTLDAAMRQVLPATLLPCPENVEAAANIDDAASVDTYRTVVEMHAEVPLLTETSILAGFERASNALRELHRAFRVATRTPVRPYTTERLHQIVAFASAELDGVLHDETGWVIAHPRLPHPVAPDVLASKDLLQIDPHMDMLRRANPWSLYTERVLTAHARLDKGDFTAATLEAAIASEMLIDATLALVHWDCEQPVETAYRQSREGIVKRVRRWLPEALGDSEAIWSVDGDGAAARWKHDVADLRNLIVHRGYPVGRDEAIRAIDTTQDLAAMIAERILVAVDRVPRAALVLLGEVAIKRAGRFTARVEAMAALDWLDAFHAWGDSLVLDSD